MIELAVAGGLAWMAIHVPSAAPPLLVGAGLVAAWAMAADGPLALVRAVSHRWHTRGLIVIGGVLAVLPFVTGRTTAYVLIPCVMAAAVLARFGVKAHQTVPTPERSAPDRAAPHGAASVGSARDPSATKPATRVDLPRVAGRLVGRLTR